MKKKKFAVLILVVAMCVGLLGGFQTVKADDLFIDVESGVSKVIEAAPGTTTHVKIPVRALNVYISSPTLLGEVSEGAPFKISNVKLTKENTVGDIMGLAVGEKAYIEFDIVMKDTATIGNYDMGIKVSYTSYDSSDFNQSTGSYATKSCKIPLIVQVTREKAPAQISISDITYDKDAAAIGNTFDISFKVKNEGEIEALNTFFSLGFGESGIVPAYSVENQKLGDLKSGETKEVKIPVTVLPTATEGFKTLTVNFSYKNADGKEDKVDKSLYVTVQKTSTSSSEDAKLVITGETYEEDIKAGTSFALNMQLENIGEQTAKDIKVSIAKGTGLDTGIIEDYEGQILEVANLDTKGKATVELPLLITKSATEGLKELTVQATYTNSEGTSITAVTKVYLMIVAEKKPTDELKNDLRLDNVVQSPANPLVGETVTITFSITNKGNNKATDIRVSGEGLSSSGFEPVSPDPYKSVGDLEPNAKAQVTMKFKVGTGISEGSNQLDILCDYKDADGKAQKATGNFYILNVMNDSNSKPKLIINNFNVSSEELRAGSEFELSIDLKNTHMSKAAKNIKITVSQKDEIFSVTEGSNIFFINRIAPGEVSTIKIPMKVKNEAVTKSYDINLTMEYEYDNMSKADAELGGVKETGSVSLQAIENARPVIQNVSVGNWDVPTVGIESAMTFDFYNMGKSALNNVYFTLEGDFTLSTGKMYFLGPVQSGGYEQVELTVLPDKEGTCSGKIIIHFEDSNGEEVTEEHEFSDVLVQAAFDPGNNGGGDDWGDIPVVQPIENAPKPIVDLWLFLVIQGAILIVVIPVVRMIGIKLHKKKLLKEDAV